MAYRMDPNAPATKRFTALLAEIWANYLATHTPEQVRALLDEVERREAIHQQMMSGYIVRPVTRESVAAD